MDDELQNVDPENPEDPIMQDPSPDPGEPSEQDPTIEEPTEEPSEEPENPSPTSAIENSILNTIKKMLGLDASYKAFDTDIIVLINSELMTLHQYGVGPKTGFLITGETEIWADFLPEDKLIESVKSYIYIKVRIIFDPPPSSYVLSAYQSQADEWLWRIKEQMEAYPGDVVDDSETEEDLDRYDELDYLDWLDRRG